MEPTIDNLDHFIGNPLFAIETNLNPLRKRIREGRVEEALEIVDNIETSINQAKTALLDVKGHNG
jgi:hypothetical protein